MKILALLRLAPIKVYDHLVPLLMHPALDHLTIVRYASVELEHPKVEQVAFGTEADGGSDGLPVLRRLYNQWALFRLAWQTARRQQPDVIYGIFFTTNGVMAWFLAKLLGKKCLVSMIGTDLNKHILEYNIGIILRWFLRRTDAITVFDEAARQKLIALNFPGERIFVMPHAIEMSRFEPQAQPKDIDALFVGMFVSLKEVHRLVAAWRLVVDQLPQAKLALVGDGVLRQALEEQVRELGLQDNVVFTGWVQDVPHYLHRARIFCNFSNQEGVPHAMLEAMACGLVPVVTAVGGVPSVIEDGVNGFLIAEPADPTQAADRLLCLLTQPELYTQMQAVAVNIRAAHDYEAVSAAWTPVLEYLNNS